MTVIREVRRPFTQFLKPGHFYASDNNRFYVSNDIEVLVMYDSYYDKDSIFKRMTFNEDTYLLIRDFLDKIRNNDCDDIEDLGMECIVESIGVKIGDNELADFIHRITYRHIPDTGEIDVKHDVVFNK